MTKALSTNQIAQLRANVAAGDISGAYAELSNQGYAYAGWAGGVARGDTISGVAAVDYLKGTALMGVGGSICQTLSNEKILAVKTGMATAYLDTLEEIANTPGNDGMVSRDISAKEVWQFHTNVFKENGLSIDNWTLNAPFTIIRKLEGDEGVERYWEFMRDTKGADSYDGIVANLATLAFMHKQTLSADPAIRDMANAWMQDVPGIYDWNQIDRSLRTALAVASVRTKNRLGELGDLLGENDSSNFIADLQSKFKQAGVTVSPLILDLDGDGVETIGKSAGIHFDHDGNRFAETTGWAGKDDGLLVWDRNGNGTIDDGNELFGSRTKLADGGNADNGFAALAGLDGNHDGVVDALDADFTQLRVWKDVDSNAHVSDGELLGLDEAGVESIEVAYIQLSVMDAQGNQHLQSGQYKRVDGSTRAMDDVWFAADMARTTDTNTVAIADDIAALPDLQGVGNVQSLHQAMARDTTGKLGALVGQFAQTLDSGERKALFDDILYTWTGSDLYAANARGSYFGDARKLYALEAFLGQTFVQGSGTNAGTNDPGPNAAQLLGETYGLLSGRLYGQLMAQTHFKDLYDSVGLTLDVDTLAISLDVSKTLDKISALYDANPEQAWSFTNEFAAGLKAAGDFGAQTIAALKTHSNLNGTGFSLFLALAVSDFMFGDSGANEMTANPGQDTNFMGMGENDRLIGNDGNNILIGGTDNDLLYGGTGNDTYVFAQGDGVDIINDFDTTAGNADTVQFTDVASTDVTSIERKRNDLVMNYGAADQLTVKGYFDPNYPGYRIERFAFSNGASWDDAAIKALVNTTGSAGYDYIAGYDDGANRIYALDGDDYLFGGSRADLIDGGAGDDIMYGRAGNDRLIGGADADTLNGEEGDDQLLGGIGNDLLYGGSGDDMYVLARGDGVDFIEDYDTTAGNTDTVQFTDVASTDVTSIERDGSDLVMKYAESDQLTVKGYFNPYYPGYRIEKFSFSDGASWDDAAIKAQAVTTGSALSDYIVGYNEGSNHIDGLDGNDMLFGGGKDDLMDGGADSDALFGGSGNDMLYGGAGDDRLSGEDGNDMLIGGNGNDSLDGGDGNDVIEGGGGNDLLYGGFGNDTYVLARGDGVDVINDYDATAGNTDVVQFKDVASADVTSLARNGDDLVMTYAETDQLTVKGYFDNNYPGYRIERFSFSDGASWDDAAIKARTITVGSAGSDYVTGYDDGSNRIDALDGNDTLLGGAMDDVISGGAGDDMLQGGAGDDTLLGGDGNDTIYGGDGNDVIDGGAGSDLLYGGDGADLIRFGKGYGADRFDSSNTAAFRLDTVDLFDLKADEVSLVRSGDTLKVMANGSDDSLTIGYFFGGGTVTTIDTLRFADGTAWDEAAIKERAITNGTTSNDYLTGYNDASNRIYGLDGYDILLGGARDDLIDGGAGDDWLYGLAGNDILQGAAGMDNLDDVSGNNLFSGGAGNDILNGGKGNDFIIGGAGDDEISTGAGYDLIAFNRGDGQDTVASGAGRDNTLSLGGGIDCADLALFRAGDDLNLTTGENESITFKDWYAGPGNHSVANLQIVVEGSSDYDAASPDSLHNRKVAQFDFDALVSRFDDASATSPGLSPWALSSALLDFHLGGSDTAAMGGDLAYQYGLYGVLSGLSVNTAQAMLASAQFGAASQMLQSGATPNDLSPRLM